jgi:hypothetical protein
MSRDIGVEHESTNTVIKGTNNSLGPAILLRRVWASEPEDHAIGGEERA